MDFYEKTAKVTHGFLLRKETHLRRNVKNIKLFLKKLSY